jgi:thioredoxin 1
MIKEITPTELETIANGPGLTVVKFSAPWCAACKAIQPAIEELAESNAEVAFVQMDADSNTDFVVDLGIRSLPSFGFYRNGEKISVEKGLNAVTLKAKVADLK